MNLIESSRAQFDSLQSAASPAEKAQRELAWAKAEKMGLPHRRTETWKYSSLNLIEKVWRPKPDKKPEVSDALKAWCRKQSNDFHVLVFMGAEWVKDLSTEIGGLEVIPAVMDGFSGEDGFANLTGALSAYAPTLRVAAGTRLKKPLLIVRVPSGTWSSTWQGIEVAEGAEIKVFEIFWGQENPYFRGHLNHLNLAKSSTVTWVRAELEGEDAIYFSDFQGELQAEAKLHLTTIHRGAKWTRSQMNFKLKGPLAEAHIQGLNFGDNDQHMDQRIVVEHLAGETLSDQLIKGVLGGRAKGSVNGKIYIAQDAQKVISKHLNHNLLLSKTAEANTKPELEIYADDVKANHGATVGRLDEEKLFYLQSRGLRAEEAEKLLSSAYAEDIFMKIPDPQLKLFAERIHVL